MILANVQGSGIPALATLQMCDVPVALTAAGTSQGAATLVTSSCHLVTTAGSQTGVILPSAALSDVGDEYKLFCDSATTMIVYPAGSETLQAAASVNVAQNKMIWLKRLSATKWAYIISA